MPTTPPSLYPGSSAQSALGPVSARARAAQVARRKIVVLINVGSGSAVKDEACQRIVTAIEAAGGDVTVVELGSPERIMATVEHAAERARLSGALLVAAGGDGTINTVAAQCCRHKIPMGVIPLGTFNYFARQLGVSEDPAEAATTLLTGRLRTIDVGFLNDRIFLNNASFGLYTQVIRQREEDKSRFGRFRAVAVLSAIKTLLRGQRPFAIRLVTPGGVQLRRTAMVFVCNNAFQLDNIGLDMSACVASGRLAVVVLKPLRKLDTMRLVWRGLTRGWSDEERLEAFCATLFNVDSRRRFVDVVLDGEVVRCSTPLSFRVAHSALQVMVPEPPAR